MPGWHEATLDLQDAGRLQMVGIIQEQHPDRCRLFMQWKRMKWPVLVDSYNLLGVSVVPIVLAVDEHGIIRMVNPRRGDRETLLSDFLDRSFEKPSRKGSPRPSSGTKSAGRAEAERDLADRRAVSADQDRVAGAIEGYQRVLAIDPQDAIAHFRFGVALRERYDSADRKPNDFQAAVDHWTHALELEPNNYIWRRRIQQYGPRLDKPYPFYDWVHRARRDISARGEIPVPLNVEPGGAELASPQREFKSVDPTRPEPDPEGRITRDTGQLVSAEVTVVPSSVRPGSAVRVHVELKPSDKTKAHWNNEADGLLVWIDPPAGVIVDNPVQMVPNPPTTLSRETRTIEFEVRCTADVQPGSLRIPAYALYYVCEDVHSRCLYRRQDLVIELRANGPKTR
ncbi:MAG: hypothetical protein IID37_16340 [Planctomycetes bacterium]|nr:hypothetical protein [Planctomycetota bacterium]